VAISDVVEPTTRTLEVRYALDNREERIPVGRGVRLRLFIGEPENLPAVPESAIVDDGGRLVVFVQTGGESFERRPVRVGNREGGYVHALEGLEPGERVVIRGAYLIRLAAMSSQIPSHGHVH
jgi:multidrug efflux pump subunit AcrA (membrane-fusion protein)